ncbi:MAG TPA: hypothetical protein VHS81_14510 [Caulobacteraceae bacterium]|nr:hypothetical protein [Caulobacteraceae bacterium]
MNDDMPEPGPAAAPRRPSLPNFVSFAMAVALVWLGGQFILQGVSDNLLDDKPELAVLTQGGSSDAVAQLARYRLQTRDPSGAARLAKKALLLSPLNARALTTYGLAMDAQRQTAVAGRVMTLAGQLGWRDLITQVWLFRRDLLAADFKDAFDHADALMRRVPSPPAPVLRILAVAARNPNAIGPLADRLAANPSWRAPFFVYLGAYEKPPATDVTGALLARLETGPSRPTDDEIGFYLAALAVQGKYQEAEAAWRQLTPGAPGGYVHNGDFERPARPTPFDWWLRSGVGWTASIDNSPDPTHGHALRIDYDGVSAPIPLRQLVVLPPGGYRLSGRMLDAGDGGSAGFAWRVACAGADAGPLAKVPSPPGAPGQWRTFSADFIVPASGCPAQLLDLAADRGDVQKDITLWYDDLAIAPQAGVAPTTQAPAPSNLDGLGKP